MSKAENTKEKLLCEGRRLFWARGYSNVSVREIAKAAKVDVALISRYYGSKMKLFEATVDRIDSINQEVFDAPGKLIDAIVQIFVSSPRNTGEPSPLNLILVNAGDPDVGDIVRGAYRVKWHEPFVEILGDETKAALFSAAILGMSVAEKTLHLPGISAPDSPDYEAQLRELLNAAVGYGS